MKQPTNHKSSTAWTADDLRMLREMYVRDVPVSTIATALGRTESAVYKAAHNNGIKRPPKGDAHLQQDLFDQPERVVIDDDSQVNITRGIPDDFYETTWDREYNMGMTIFAIACAFMLVFALFKGDII